MRPPTFRIRPASGIGPNTINIQLWGFKNCRVADAGGVGQTLTLLPAHLLVGLKNIHFEPVALVPGITRWIRVPSRTQLLGRYDKQSASIVLHSPRSRRELFQALLHELGHFVYFRIISSGDKKQWVTKIYKSETPVTRYGARNAAEDFAEAFSRYLMEAEAMQNWPIKNAYVRDVVFRGIAVDHSALAAIIASQRENDVVSRLDRYV